MHVYPTASEWKWDRNVTPQFNPSMGICRSNHIQSIVIIPANVFNFTAIATSLLLILLLVPFLQVVGSWILVRTNTLLLILQLWLILLSIYLGNDHLCVGDDKSLFISYIGHTMLRSPKCIFTLSNALHVPHITNHCYLFKNFVVIIMFILNFTCSVFYVNDLTTKAVLLSD